MCDTLWSDPDDRYPGWALSARGISFTFSSKVIKEFCETNNIDLIVRGHQLTADVSYSIACLDFEFYFTFWIIVENFSVPSNQILFSFKVFTEKFLIFGFT